MAEPAQSITLSLRNKDQVKINGNFVSLYSLFGDTALISATFSRPCLLFTKMVPAGWYTLFRSTHYGIPAT